MATQPRISASRVPMMMGESKWGTRLKLYHELRGDGPPKVEDEDSELLSEGRDFEPVILARGAKKFRMKLVEGPRELIHGDLIGHPDGYVIDEHGKLAVGEAKNLLFANVGEEAGWGEADTDRVPMAYWYQCQTYGWLLLKLAPDLLRMPLMFESTGGGVGRWEPGQFEVSDTVYLFARLWHGLRRFKIKVDPEVCARIELEASAFLDRVARGEPPDPMEVEEFRRRWSPVPKKTIEFTEREFGILKAKVAMRAQVKQAEEAIKEMDIQLLGYMGDASIGTYQGRKVLNAGADRKFDEEAFSKAHPELWGGPAFRSFDAALLKAEHPALHEEFLKLPPPEVQTRKLRPSKDLEGS